MHKYRCDATQCMRTVELNGKRKMFWGAVLDTSSRPVMAMYVMVKSGDEDDDVDDVTKILQPLCICLLEIARSMDVRAYR